MNLHLFDPEMHHLYLRKKVYQPYDQLKKVSSLIVQSDRILFKKPTINSKPLANIKNGRLLVIKKCEKNWCKVSTNNYSGWITTENVWGKN